MYRQLKRNSPGLPAMVGGLALLVLLAPGAALAAPALPEEMEQAIRSAMRSHPEVYAADAGLLSAKSQVKAGEFRWYPRAELGARTLGKSSERNTSIGLRQTLWDFGKLNAEFEGSKAGESAAAAEKYATIESIGTRAALSYLNVARSREQFKVAGQNVNDHTKLYSSIANRKEGGLGTKSDVTLATSRLQQARASAESARGEVGRAEESFVSVVGTAPQAAELPILKMWDVPGGKEGVIARVSQRSPVLQKLREDIRAAEAGVRVQESQLYPTLYARVDNTNYYGGNNPLDNDTRFTVNFEWQNDIALSQRYRIEAAKHKVVAAQRQLEAEERKLAEAVGSYWENYLAALKRSQEVDQFATSAEATVDTFKKQFSIGKRSWPEVMNTLIDLFSARSQQVDARYEALASRIQLAFLGGEMDELIMQTPEAPETPQPAANPESGEVSK